MLPEGSETDFKHFNSLIDRPVFLHPSTRQQGIDSFDKWLRWNKLRNVPVGENDTEYVFDQPVAGHGDWTSFCRADLFKKRFREMKRNPKYTTIYHGNDISVMDPTESILELRKEKPFDSKDCFESNPGVLPRDAEINKYLHMHKTGSFY